MMLRTSRVSETAMATAMTLAGVTALFAVSYMLITVSTNMITRTGHDSTIARYYGALHTIGMIMGAGIVGAVIGRTAPRFWAIASLPPLIFYGFLAVVLQSPNQFWLSWEAPLAIGFALAVGRVMSGAVHHGETPRGRGVE